MPITRTRRRLYVVRGGNPASAGAAPPPPPPLDNFEASGCGVAEVNQVYVKEATTFNGKPWYRGDDSGLQDWYISWNGTRWNIDPGMKGAPTPPPAPGVYQNAGTDATPPLTGWTANFGPPPAPTLAAHA